jgi:peptide/nickel transport system substrate-binding protein
MPKASPRMIASLAILLFALLTACKSSPLSTTPDVATTSPASSQANLLPTSGETETVTPSPIPSRTLTICLANEPQSLFLYGDDSQEARLVREAINDGPYDLLSSGYVPVILEDQPALSNSDIRFEPSPVSEGDLIVSADGTLTNLTAGVSYIPSGCQTTECELVYQDDAAIQMDQAIVRFRLKQGIRWSDGTSLTADDSLYSYEVARALFPQVRADLLTRTQSYQALDSYTLEWRGIPGFRSSQFTSFIFDPLPRHTWGSLTKEELLTSELTTRHPLGWGAYVLDRWVAGEAIYLNRNPLYFRAAEGLPGFDFLILRFIPDQDQAINALQEGDCDILDARDYFEYGRQALSGDGSIGSLIKAGKIAMVNVEDTAWEHLDFGIVPIDSTTFPAILTQKEIRQALASCIDRQRIVTDLYGENLPISDTYLAPTHPLNNFNATAYPFDPELASSALQSTGWIDGDGDPATARISQGVAGVPDGTPFELNLLVAQDSTSQESATIIKESLAQCGVVVEVDGLPYQELLAAGPDGPIFGRNFQLAQYAWQTSLDPPCFLYISTEIPGPYPDYAKGWGGANTSGISIPEFDQQCALALSSLPEEPSYTEAHNQAQTIFAEELPALPLFMHRLVLLIRPDLCGLQPDAFARSLFWNLELVDYGEACQQKPGAP